VFADVALPLALTLIMGSLGLTLTPADFRRVVTAPKGIGIGLFNLLLLSPLLAFSIGEIYGLTAALAVGVVLLGASPGGTTANLLTNLARGDVALSVSMTAISSVASVITVPLYLSLGASYFDAQDVSDEISMPGVAASVFLITIVPLSIGMLIRAKRTAWALRNMQRARTVALVAFTLVVIGAIISEFDVLSESFAEVAAAVVTLNVAAMTFSFLIARAARLDGRQATAIAMELGVHNTTVALAVATSVSDELAGPAAVYGIFMFFTAGLFARYMARRNAREVPVAEPSRGGFEVVAEVRGRPDAVWRAISTGPGLSAWLAPAEVDGDRLRLDLGALGHADARVIARDAPVRFAFAEEGWFDGAPPLITDLQVQDDAGGRSRVRLVNRVDGEADPQLRGVLAAMERTWRPALVALDLSLEHPDGDSHHVEASAPVDGWERVAAALDVRGGRAQAGPLSGTVAHRQEGALVLRLDAPAPGHAIVTVEDGPAGSLAVARAWLHGPDGPSAARDLQAALEAWLRGV
jgi:bile acid:Na+ symporter, BASS family